MNSIENLKSTQLRKLFKVFKSRSMQSSNIFRARKNFLFEFANLSGVWKLEIIFYEARPTCHHAESSSAPVASDRHRPTWVAPPPPLIPAPDVTEEAATHNASPSHRSAALLTALLRTSRRFAASELLDHAKRSASSPCPFCTKNLPVAPASEAGQWDSPHRRLTP
jgi:hypothetical protein